MPNDLLQTTVLILILRLFGFALSHWTNLRLMSPKTSTEMCDLYFYLTFGVLGGGTKTRTAGQRRVFTFHDGLSHGDGSKLFLSPLSTNNAMDVVSRRRRLH